MVEIFFGESCDGELGSDGGEAARVRVSGGATQGVNAFRGGTVFGAEFKAAPVRLAGSCWGKCIFERKNISFWGMDILVRAPYTLAVVGNSWAYADSNFSFATL